MVGLQKRTAYFGIGQHSLSLPGTPHDVATMPSALQRPIAALLFTIEKRWTVNGLS
jgi:hypothetical protein